MICQYRAGTSGRIRPLILHVLETTTPQGEMIFTLMAALAQFEHALISARVKAGMAQAKV